MSMVDDRLASVGGSAGTIKADAGPQIVGFPMERKGIELAGQGLFRRTVFGVDAAPLVVHKKDAAALGFVIEDVFARVAKVGLRPDPTGPVLFVDLLAIDRREVDDQFAAAIRAGVAGEMLALEFRQGDGQLHNDSIA